MRAVKIYFFKIGTKIPFSEWPGIVDRFLREQGLKFGAFRYYFSADNDSKDKTACHKALKDCKNLGPIMMNKSHSTAYLTNIGMDTGASKAEIMPLMSKIYRSYGFTDTSLIYQDVEFFGKVLTAMDQGDSHGPCRYFGSSIRLFRDRYDTQWNGIELHVDILRDGEILDAEPYREAMQKLLPGMKCSERLAYQLDEEDKELYAKVNTSAKPLIEEAGQYIQTHMPSEDTGGTPGLVPVATILKKLCRKYKYKYAGCEYYVYTIRKKTARGHYLVLELISGPSRWGLDICIGFQGMGFNHRIGNLRFELPNQEKAEVTLGNLFSLLASAEKTVFEKLDNHFPTSPDWFIPEDII